MIHPISLIMLSNFSSEANASKMHPQLFSCHPLPGALNPLNRLLKQLLQNGQKPFLSPCGYCGRIAKVYYDQDSVSQLAKLKAIGSYRPSLIHGCCISSQNNHISTPLKVIHSNSLAAPPHSPSLESPSLLNPLNPQILL